MPVIPALERWRWENQKFRVTLSYMVSSRSVWTTWEERREEEIKGGKERGKKGELRVSHKT